MTEPLPTRKQWGHRDWFTADLRTQPRFQSVFCEVSAEVPEFLQPQQVARRRSTDLCDRAQSTNCNYSAFLFCNGFWFQSDIATWNMLSARQAPQLKASMRNTVPWPNAASPNSSINTTAFTKQLCPSPSFINNSQKPTNIVLNLKINLEKKGGRGAEKSKDSFCPGTAWFCSPFFCQVWVKPLFGLWISDSPSQELIVLLQAKYENDNLRYLIMELIFLLKIRV